jgi:hypothetical protein
VQDLNYHIKDIRVNEEAVVYDFSSKRYPSGYQPEKG